MAVQECRRDAWQNIQELLQLSMLEASEIYLAVIPQTAWAIFRVEENTIQLLFGLHHLACAERQNFSTHTPVVRCPLEKLSSAQSAKTKSNFPILDWVTWCTRGRFLQLYICVIALNGFKDMSLLLWVLTQNDNKWSIPKLSIWNESNKSKISMIHPGQPLKTVKARPCAMVIKQKS